MYQDKIIQTILSGDVSAFMEIKERDHIVFTDKSDLAFYNILYDHFLKYNKVPSGKFLEEFFALEKDNSAKTCYNRVIKGSDISEDLTALINTQIQYNVKQKILNLSGSYSDKLSLSNTSEIKDLSYDYQSNISELTQYLEGNIHRRGLLYGEKSQNDFKKKYEKIKNSDRGYYLGNTGFESIDKVIGGIHSVDKFTILGFTNQGKSPFLRQICYNLLLQGLNAMFVSLEMDYDSIETSFYSLHANNSKVFGFNRPNIRTKNIREGLLIDDEEKYLMDEVIEDFNNNSDYGSLYLLQPECNFCLDDLFMEVNKVNTSEMPIDVLFIDYAVPLIMPYKKGGRFETGDYNAMHRRLRLFSLSFDNGRGLPIFDCCQANRTGFSDALSKKNLDNLYNLTAIGEYNAIEKDSTHIISIIQTDDMKAEGSAQIQHLKSRESMLFKHFRVKFDGGSGWLRESISDEMSDIDVQKFIQDIDWI